MAARHGYAVRFICEDNLDETDLASYRGLYVAFSPPQLLPEKSRAKLGHFWRSRGDPVSRGGQPPTLPGLEAFGLSPLRRQQVPEPGAQFVTARVVGAFHHVSAVSLWKHDGPLDHEDVLVCGDDLDAKGLAIELARCVSGRDGIDAGALRLARQLEPLTAVLISINKRYKTRSGIRIAGV